MPAFKCDWRTRLLIEQPAVTGIDHPIIAVRNMAAARAAYERLGFTVTPRGRHRPWGTGNWCIMFDRNYLELRGVIDPAETHDLGAFLAQHEGLMGLAFGVEDAEASRSALERRGLRVQPVRQLTRDFELSEGVVQPRFATCFLDPADVPGLTSAVLCQHLTPDLLRRPDWLRHANGACAVRQVACIAPDLAVAAEAYAKVLGPQAIANDGRGVQVQVRAGQSILLITNRLANQVWPEAALSSCGQEGRPFALTLEAADLAATKRYFTSRGVAFHRSAAGALRILPTESCGVPLEFIGRD